MNNLRVLYLDTLFENVPGGDKNRSRLIWRALTTHFETSLLLIGRDGPPGQPVWNRIRPLVFFPPFAPPFPRPAAAPAFRPVDRRRLLEIVREGKFDVVFARFTIGWELLDRLARESPQTTIVMDVDMLSSRLVALTWAANPTFKNRWFLFEKWKLERFERKLFRQPWLFLFANALEQAGVREQAGEHARGEFAVLPNMLPATPELKPARQPVILFFGSLDSSANVDGVNFLVDEVLPLIGEDLRRQQVKIRIVGKKPPGALVEKLRHGKADLVELVGPVDSIEAALAEALFVLLPLRIASGTRTRILEAAALGRAVVTTTMGAEGLDVGDTVLIGDTAAELAAHTRQLLANQAQADELGQRLRDRAVSLYAARKVAADLMETVSKFAARREGAGP